MSAICSKARDRVCVVAVRFVEVADACEYDRLGMASLHREILLDEGRVGHAIGGETRVDEPQTGSDGGGRIETLRGAGDGAHAAPHAASSTRIVQPRVRRAEPASSSAGAGAITVTLSSVFAAMRSA